eukprot:6179180-Pleurochrysis_carterae.AAC.2
MARTMRRPPPGRRIATEAAHRRRSGVDWRCQPWTAAATYGTSQSRAGAAAPEQSETLTEAARPTVCDRTLEPEPTSKRAVNNRQLRLQVNKAGYVAICTMSSKRVINAENAATLAGRTQNAGPAKRQSKANGKIS